MPAKPAAPAPFAGMPAAPFVDPLFGTTEEGPKASAADSLFGSDEPPELPALAVKKPPTSSTAAAPAAAAASARPSLFDKKESTVDSSAVRDDPLFGAVKAEDKFSSSLFGDTSDGLFD